MVTYLTSRPSRRRPLIRGLLVAAAVVGGALVVGILYLLPVVVTVDGQVRTVRPGQTALQLAAQGGFVAHPGNLVSVRGRLLRREGGEPPSFISNGHPLDPNAPLSPGLALRSVPGRDVVESIVTTEVKVPTPVSVIGTGPAQVVQDAGAPGRDMVREGAISHQVVTSVTVVAARPKILRAGPFPPGARLVALTFDDGPWRGQTERILKILDASGVKATFFMVGNRVRANPWTARKVASDGQLIGNHSMTHAYLKHPTAAQVRSELDRAQTTIVSVTGVMPRWYRPAGGYHTAQVDKEARRLGLTVIKWDVDPKDFTRPPSEVIVRRVVGGAIARKRTVVLMHDGGGDRTQTIIALPRIIRLLRKKGFYLVTLDQMAQAH